ncbi:hypothetical protein [Roseitalea porphyridii]|nr:hypothetical protein [Roseitalea porphyridii]
MNINVRLTVSDLIAALRRAALHTADARAQRLADEAASNKDERR